MTRANLSANSQAPRPANRRRRIVVWSLAATLLGVVAAGGIFLRRFDYGQSALSAVARGDSRRLNLLLRIRPELVRRCPGGTTLLHEAVAHSRADMAGVLLARGADINAPDAEGLTVLWRAIQAQNAGMVRFLLEHGADPNAPGPFNVPPLLAAVDLSQPDILRMLLDRGADANTRDSAGRTALERPWTDRSIEVLRLLLNRGVDADPAYVVPALTIILQHGDKDPAANYLNAYPRINRRSKVASAEGGTMLHLAVSAGNRLLLEMLLGHGADISAPDGRGWTPLDVAIAGLDSSPGRPEIVWALLAVGADADTERLYRALALGLESGQSRLVATYLGQMPNLDGKRDRQGRGLLHYAIAAGNLSLVRLLLDYGADVTATDWQSLYPLHVAVTAPRSAGELTALLLARKADPNERDLFERTPLHLAVMGGADPAVLKLLLDAGAKVHLRCDEGYTALNRAAEAGRKEHIRLLLARKADPNGQDPKGRTPLHHAALGNDRELAEMLLAAGAGTRIRDSSRMLARVYASQKGYQEIADLILRVEAERAAAATTRKDE